MKPVTLEKSVRSMGWLSLLLMLLLASSGVRIEPTSPAPASAHPRPPHLADLGLLP